MPPAIEAATTSDHASMDKRTQGAPARRSLIASVVPDLRALSPVLWICMSCFAVLVIIFSIINVDYRRTGARFLLWDNDKALGISQWRRVLMCLSGAASFTGVMSVVLAAKGFYSTFFWGIINVILLGPYLFAYGYAGNAQLNVLFFLPLQFVGIWTWRTTRDDETVAIPRSLSWTLRVETLLAVVVLSVAFYYEIPAFSRAVASVYFFDGLLAPHLLDAITTALSVVAQILLTLRYWEQWVFWIANNVLQLVLFSGGIGVPLSLNILLMNVLFLVNSFFGCYTWWRRSRKPVGLERKLVGDDAWPQFSEGVEEDDITTHPRRGLVVGKFWPPHNGHLFILDYASRHCHSLHIAICERRDRVEVPSGGARQDYLASRYPNAAVTVLEDKYDPDNSEVWARVVREHLGFVPDVVFTSESYGDAFCQLLGSRHVEVDKKREAVPISATLVRSEPFEYWSYLPPFSQAAFVLRVVVVGAESTGKSTLCARLAAHYGVAWVPEVGRELAEQKLADDAYVWTESDFVYIAETQSAREDHAASTSGRQLLICDTDAFATMLWHERYLGQRSSLVERVAESRPRPSLYLLPEVGSIPFVQDGTRDGEHLREEMAADFAKYLTASGRRFTVLKGDYEGIFHNAIAAIDGLLEERGSTHRSL